MYTESRKLSQLQVAESLLRTKHTEGYCRTLHTDGNSKFGKHYGTHDVVTDKKQNLMTGIREVLPSHNETQLHILLDILSEIEESLRDTEKNLSNKTISTIKNIMSDRHIVQKKINSVFQDYRTSVLLNIVENWDAANEDIKSNFIKVNAFS